jgi:ATP-binding cassette, subfamily B, bacterial MsbA
MVLLAWLCAILVAVLYFFSVGSMLPLLQVMFGEQTGVTISTHTVEDPDRPGEEIQKPYVVVPQGFRVERVAADGSVRLDTEQRVLTVPEGYDLVPGGLDYFVEGSQGKFYHGAVAWGVGLLPESRVGQIAAIMGALVVLTALRCGFRFLNGWIVGFVACRAVMRIQEKAFHSVLRLPLSHFHHGGAAEANSRLINDAFHLREGVQSIFGKVVLEPLRAVAGLSIAVICALAIDWRLLLLIFVFGPLCAWVIRRFARKMRRATKKGLQSAARILGIIQESLSALHVVKAFGMEGRERRRFFSESRRYLRQAVRAFKTQAATSPTLEFLATLAVALAMIVGAQILSGATAQEQRTMIMFFGALVMAFDPMRKLANVNNRVQAANAAAERIFELIDATPEPRHGSAGTELPRLVQAIRFENVGFHYVDGGDEVLRNINLEVAAGETLAIVGRTGCGKSTLMNLLPRFYSPTSGRVTFDGTDIEEVTLRSLRDQIGVVTQETILFSDTVAANIAYGSRPAARAQQRGGRVTREEIVEAAQMAHADEFIRQLPNGYDTELGTLGKTLSGGERQRLALARAIIRDPAILVLDEATSALDEETQALVQDTLERFVQGRTVLVIAHRLSTIALARRIAVMDAGRIADLGTHDELMTRCKLYRTLYDTGLGEA